MRLKQIREEKGLSQNELAKKINMTQQRISSYEKGIREPDIETLKILADFFNVSIDYLLDKTDKRNNDIDLSEVRIAQYGGIDTNGLSEEDIEEIKKQVEYMRWKRKNK